MSKKATEKRRSKFQDVLNVILERPEFDQSEVHASCNEAKLPFVRNVVQQLAADCVLSILPRENRKGPARYAWAVDRSGFDVEAWIETQISGGNQIANAPVEERPRERLGRVGVENLKESELVAILIRAGRKGESAVQAGQRVASHFEGKLQMLPDYSPGELKKVSSAVSIVAYCQIMAGIELGRRVEAAARANVPKVKINSTKAAIEYCSRHFARLAHDARQEEFHIVTLDTKLQPIQSHQITVGTLDASLVHPREVFKAAIRDSASSILLVHNHPSGDPTPSRQDREVTDRLKQAGTLLGINVIDHVIVAKDETVSLAEWS